MDQEHINNNDDAPGSILDFLSVCWTTPSYKTNFNSDNSSEEMVNITTKGKDPYDICSSEKSATYFKGSNSGDMGHTERNSGLVYVGKNSVDVSPNEQEIVNRCIEKNKSANITFQEKDIPNTNLRGKDLANVMEEMAPTNTFNKDDLANVHIKYEDSNNVCLERKDDHDVTFDGMDSAITGLNKKISNNFLEFNFSHNEKQSAIQNNHSAEANVQIPNRDNLDNLTLNVQENQSSELFGISCPYDLRGKYLKELPGIKINKRNSQDIDNLSNYSSSDHVSDPDWRYAYVKKPKKKQFRRKCTFRRETFSLPCLKSTPISEDVHVNSEKPYVSQLNEKSDSAQPEPLNCIVYDNADEVSCDWNNVRHTYSYNLRNRQSQKLVNILDKTKEASHLVLKEDRPNEQPNKIKKETSSGRIRSKKRKGNFVNQEAKRFCFPVLQAKPMKPQQSSIVNFLGRNKNNITRSWDSTIKAKRMLLDVGAALNQIESVLTDWKYKSRIPTLEESSSLLSKIQKINEELTEGYNDISESASQPEILENFLDCIKKSENIRFSIQRRIKKLNKKCSLDNLNTNLITELLTNLKINTPQTKFKIRSPLIFKKQSILLANDLTENSLEYSVLKNSNEQQDPSKIINSPSRNCSYNEGLLQKSYSTSFQDILKNDATETNTLPEHELLNSRKECGLLNSATFFNSFSEETSNKEEKYKLKNESFLKTDLSKIEVDLPRKLNDNLNEFEECIDSPQKLKNCSGKKTSVNLKKYRKSTLKFLSQNSSNVKENENQFIPNGSNTKGNLLEASKAQVLERRNFTANNDKNGPHEGTRFALGNNISFCSTSNSDLKDNISTDNTESSGIPCNSKNSLIFNNEKVYLKSTDEIPIGESNFLSSKPHVDSKNENLPVIQYVQENKASSLKSQSKSLSIFSKSNGISTAAQPDFLNGTSSVLDSQKNIIASIVINGGNQPILAKGVGEIHPNIESSHIIPLSSNKNMIPTYYAKPLTTYKLCTSSEIGYEKQLKTLHKKSNDSEQLKTNIPQGTKLVSISGNFNICVAKTVPIRNKQAINASKINSSIICNTYEAKGSNDFNVQGEEDWHSEHKSNQLLKTMDFPKNEKPTINKSNLRGEANKVDGFASLPVKNNQNVKQLIWNNTNSINIDVNQDINTEHNHWIDPTELNLCTDTFKKEAVQISGEQTKSQLLNIFESYTTSNNVLESNSTEQILNIKKCDKNEIVSTQNFVEENMAISPEKCAYSVAEMNTDEFLRDSLDIDFTNCPMKEISEKISPEELSLFLNEPEFMISSKQEKNIPYTESCYKVQALVTSDPSLEEIISNRIFQQVFSNVKYQSGEICLNAEEYNSEDDFPFEDAPRPPILKKNSSNNSGNRKVHFLPCKSSVSSKLFVDRNSTINTTAPENSNKGHSNNNLCDDKLNFKKIWRANTKSNDPIKNIKYVRVKSEGEYLSAKDLSDFSSPNIFIW